MVRITRCLALVAALGLLQGCSSLDLEIEDFLFWGHDNIPLSAVPENVMVAAQEAVPGIELIEAEVDDENNEGMLIYELEGRLDGRRYEIEVAADGTVIEVEAADDAAEDDD